MDFVKLSEDPKIGIEACASKRIRDEIKNEAAAYLMVQLEDVEKGMLREMILKCRNPYWFAGIHADDELGGKIREILRKRGYGEEFFKLPSIDWLYKLLIERAIIGDEVDFNSPPFELEDPFWREADEGDWPWT